MQDRKDVGREECTHEGADMKVRDWQNAYMTDTNTRICDYRYAYYVCKD